MNSICPPGRAPRIVLLGCGAINSRVAGLLQSRRSAATIVGMIVRRPHLLPSDIAAGAVMITHPEQLADLGPDIVVEAASGEAVREWGAAALHTARRVVVTTASALADDDLLRELKSIARQSGSQLILSPGALAGVEALSAAARLGLQEVRHRIIKPPKSWGVATERDEKPITLFAGSAREAAKRYPLNANVVVVSALASLGLDQTEVELISDHSAVANCHEIRASGDFGNMMVRIENRPLHLNPKSSELAALALVRLVENEVADLVL